MPPPPPLAQAIVAEQIAPPRRDVTAPQLRQVPRALTSAPQVQGGVERCGAPGQMACREPTLAPERHVPPDRDAQALSDALGAEVVGAAAPAPKP